MLLGRRSTPDARFSAKFIESRSIMYGFAALKNPEGFFNASEKALRAPEILRDFRAAR